MGVCNFFLHGPSFACRVSSCSQDQHAQCDQCDGCFCEDHERSHYPCYCQATITIDSEDSESTITADSDCEVLQDSDSELEFNDPPPWHRNIDMSSAVAFTKSLARNTNSLCSDTDWSKGPRAVQTGDSKSHSYTRKRKLRDASVIAGGPLLFSRRN